MRERCRLAQWEGVNQGSQGRPLRPASSSACILDRTPDKRSSVASRRPQFHRTHLIFDSQPRHIGAACGITWGGQRRPVLAWNSDAYCLLQSRAHKLTCSSYEPADLLALFFEMRWRPLAGDVPFVCSSRITSDLRDRTRMCAASDKGAIPSAIKCATLRLDSTCQECALLQRQARTAARYAHN